MPRGDGTGPNGQGPMTGRAMGYCAGNEAPGFVYGSQGGRGMRRSFGRGMGRGFRQGFRNVAMPMNESVEITPEQEKAYLAQQLENLQDSVSAIQERLDKLK